MGKRNTARRLAVQALYQADLSHEIIDQALDNIVESEDFIPETKKFASQLAKSAWDKREEIDKIISKMAIDWPLERIGKVDRAILRLSLAELAVAETPVSVIINEAVELAKKYSSPEAAKFINGILGAFVRKKDV
ncbi:MAG: transcription antitermination factor NusB [Candidatus Margulisbacteria bacterium]|nr:transcription antitermination factor NusB [Candidatus Margulisiibacteriota bacterium]